MRMICAWCKKKQLRGKVWVPLDATTISPTEKVSHGVCLECSKQLDLEIEALIRAQQQGEKS